MFPPAVLFQTRCKEFKEDWIGTLPVKAVFYKLHYLLADWQGNCYPSLVQYTDTD